MNTSPKKLPALVFRVSKVTSARNDLTPKRSWTSATMAQQVVHLAAGLMGSGIQPSKPVKVLVMHPSDLLLDDSWTLAYKDIGAASRVSISERIKVLKIASSVCGLKFVEHVRDALGIHQPDVLVIHSVTSYFGSGAAACYTLIRKLPQLGQHERPHNNTATSVRVASNPGSTEPEHNTVIFAPGIVFHKMHDEEGGPVAWTQYFASEVDILHSAALSAGGVGGFFKTSQHQRVIILSPFLLTATGASQATHRAAKNMTPPSAACIALQAVRWVPITSGTGSTDLELLIMREALHWRDLEDYVIVVWHFNNFGVPREEAAAFLSKAILGFAVVEPERLD